MSEDQKNEDVEEENSIAVAEFLESAPPSTLFEVKDLIFFRTGGYFILRIPSIEIHCDICDGVRVFRSASRINKPSQMEADWIFKFTCSNCAQTSKNFYIRYTTNDAGDSNLYKYGEYPPFGPPTPRRLFKLIETDKDNFLKGRRCETQGLGVGAFAYYRRVVENQKDRILTEVLRVAKKLQSPQDKIEILEAAIKEGQFKKALDDVKEAIPQALLIGGNNPFTLLHNALSEGLHGKKDKECLELAHDVRIVLVELSDQLAQALKDEAEVKQAVSNLLNR